MKILGGPPGRVIIANAATNPVYISSPDGITVSSADSPSIDAFSRQRVSNPISVYGAQFTYDLAPLLYEQVVSGSGAAITHDTTNRAVLMTFNTTPDGGTCYMQSYEHIRYQEGNGQLVFVTFNFQSPAANTTKFAGYGVHGANGIFFEVTAAGPRWAIHSDTDQGDNTAEQTNWNIDKLDGTGPSGVTLGNDKTQIAVIDFQALYVGRVRVGFDVNGLVVYCHEFLHANVVEFPYIQTANLPITCGMKATGEATTTMRFVCSAVKSEGGADDVSGYTFAASGAATAGNNSRVHLLSVRPRLTFNSIVNRSKFQLESVDIVVTGSNPVFWELAVGQESTGSWVNTNETYSAFEYEAAGSLVGDPAIVIAAGYVAATNQAKSSLSREINNRFPITLNAAGAHRWLGTLCLIVTGIGGTSATRATINWREIR